LRYRIESIDVPQLIYKAANIVLKCSGTRDAIAKMVSRGQTMKLFCVSVVWVAQRWMGAALLFSFVFSMLACAAKRTVLVPAPNATLAAQPNSAQGLSQGVSVVVQTNAWDDYPRSLEKELIPIKIAIQNHSGRDLAIRYDDFVLACRNNRRYDDIPPYQIRAHDYEHLKPSWAYPDAYYAEVRLPTQAMLKEAVSEA
jgi:hypothetical protein